MLQLDAECLAVTVGYRMSRCYVGLGCLGVGCKMSRCYIGCRMSRCWMPDV